MTARPAVKRIIRIVFDGADLERKSNSWDVPIARDPRTRKDQRQPGRIRWLHVEHGALPQSRMI